MSENEEQGEIRPMSPQQIIEETALSIRLRMSDNTKLPDASASLLRTEGEKLAQWLEGVDPVCQKVVIGLRAKWGLLELSKELFDQMKHEGDIVARALRGKADGTVVADRAMAERSPR